MNTGSDRDAGSGPPHAQALDAVADDGALAGLLRHAGRRPEPTAAATAAVRAAVAAEWRQVVATQAVRRRRQTGWRAAGGLALAASVAGVALLVLRTPSPPAPLAPVADVLTVAGPVQVAMAGTAGWQVLAGGLPLPPGAALATARGGRVAVRLRAGGELRLDEDTRVALLGGDSVELRQGGLYFDSGSAAPAGNPVAVVTARGVVRHLGTQFQVRAAPADGPVTVSVREGRVALRSPSGEEALPAGQRIVLLADGRRERAPIRPDDPEWQWAQQAAPLYVLEQHSLAEFLAWVARETGARLEFSSAADRAAAEQVRLRGSVAGLTPAQALPAVMATTRFTYRREGERLAVARQR